MSSQYCTMNKQQWTAPVWSKNMCPFNEGKRKDIRYIYPDWGNAGPGVISLGHHIENQQTEGLRLQSSISSPSTCFTTLKDIQKKFPLKTIHQYSYPLLQPQRLYPQQHIHHSLAGNCLDVVEIGGQTLVIHVEFAGDMQQGVVASRLLPGRYYQSNELKKDDKYFHLERHSNVLVDKSVCQVLSKSLHNDVHVLVRSPSRVQVAGLGQSWLIKNNLEVCGDSITSDAALSSVLPELWSLVTVSGEVTLHDANVKQPLWTTCYRATKKTKNESARIFKCDFGRHPLVLFVGNESSVRLYDTRMCPDSHRDLFDIKNVKDYISTHESICNIVSGNDQPHLYLVMDECVYVIDDRQHKTPLMHWRHMLPERPTLSTLNKLNSLEILMMSSTQNKEVCMISSEWECGKQQCHGVSVPCHFPILRDTAAFAHSHGVWFTNQVQERLDNSKWLGMASLPHPAESDNILFLSLHNSGDIFMSQFQTLHSEKDTVTHPLDDSQGQTILTRWEEDVLDISSHNWSRSSVDYVDVTGFFSQVLSKSSSVHVEEMLTGLPEIKFNHLNANFNGTETKGLHKSNNNVQESADSKCGVKTCSESSIGKKYTFPNAEKPTKEKSHIWNLKDQVQAYRSNCAPKYKGGAAWNKSLMETYVVDYTVDPLSDFPVFSSDSCIDDSLSKFLPGSVLLDLKMNKIKHCDDFLSQRIMSLWLGGENPNIKNEEAVIEGRGTSDGKLSSLAGVLEAPISRHGFRYHTSPLELARMSARLGPFQPHHSRDDQSPELDELSESYTRVPEITFECSQKTSVKSKRVGKKLKRKRVDGF